MQASPLNNVVDNATHPFWAVGLDGKGQILGFGDSGLDMDHCDFVDPDVPFELNGVGSEDTYPVFASTVHRKVALYYMCAASASFFKIK